MCAFENIFNTNVLREEYGPFLKEMRRTIAKNGDFRFHGKPASNSPAGIAHLALAPAGDQ